MNSNEKEVLEDMIDILHRKKVLTLKERTLLLLKLDTKGAII